MPCTLSCSMFNVRFACVPVANFSFPGCARTVLNRISFMSWTSGSAEASRSPLTVLRTSRIPAVGACCFPAISPPNLAADRSVSPLPPNYRPPGNIDYCHLPRVASQFGRRILALPARQARSNHVTVRVQLKVTHPSSAVDRWCKY